MCPLTVWDVKRLQEPTFGLTVRLVSLAFIARANECSDLLTHLRPPEGTLYRLGGLGHTHVPRVGRTVVLSGDFCSKGTSWHVNASPHSVEPVFLLAELAVFWLLEPLISRIASLDLIQQR
jgi:hypothetical protein